MDGAESVGSGVDDATPNPGSPEGVRLVFGPPSAVGLLAAGFLLFLSITPSLLPRSWLKQGALSGISMAVGYAIGALLWSGLAGTRPQRANTLVRARLSLVAAAVVGVGLIISKGSQWDAQLRGRVHIPPAESWEPIAGFAFGLGIAMVLVLISRMLRVGTRGTVRALNRFVPARTSVTVGASISALLVFGLIQGVVVDGTISAVSSTYSLLDRDTSGWVRQPTSPLQSGGPGSLVAWDTLGRMGRDFVGDGGRPSVAELSDFAGTVASEPVRVYVGLQSASSLESRVQLLLDEIERAGGLDRSIVAVVVTTGTGWVDPVAAETLEFMYAGDTAVAALQYSYLPSWVSFLVDRTTAAEAGKALIDAVAARIKTLRDPPRLVVFGESLGSLAAATAFEDARDASTRTDGVLLAGPMYADPLRASLTAAREPSSPTWRPIVDGGRRVRFSSEPDDLDSSALYPDADPDDLRLVYLQNESDPVPRFTFALGYRKPAWLDEPRGSDTSPAMRWSPLVTMTQVAADLAFAMDVPPGYGHNYTSSIVTAWVALAAPTGWTDANTAELTEVVSARVAVRDQLKAGTTP